MIDRILRLPGAILRRLGGPSDPPADLPVRRGGPSGPPADLRDIERAIKKLTEAQRDQSTRLEARIAAVAEQVGQRSTAKDANEIFHAVRALANTLDRDADAALFKTLDAVAKGTGPIIVGPWTGEVGFEVLYWAPFVEWFRSRWRVAESRFVVISRGGTASWYAMPQARYADIFSVVSPAVFRQRTDQDKHKQRAVLAFDREIVDAVTRSAGLNGATHLHPEAMYRALARFWRDEAGFGLIQRFTTHRRLSAFDHPTVPRLPADYIAARFYFSDAFPDTAANRALAHSVVASLAKTTPVVLLNPGVRVDDHADYAPAVANIVTLPGELPPEENLAIQSAVISRARAFVGTYGGYSYLAPFYGVPAVGFYSNRNFKLHHLHVAQRVFGRLGGAGVTAVNAADAALIQAATAIAPA